ncbi:MAG: DUF1573 domain-containing protein [Eubacteriales bacterium]|nr:DUF1573 domain-containing protein [Eubacteriales bacterium]
MDSEVQEFRRTVNGSLAFNKGILDCLTKYQTATAALARVIVKASSLCGCIHIAADQQHLSPGSGLDDLSELMKTHITGDLCRRCRENVEREIATSLYYLTAIANAFGTDIGQLMESETRRGEMLGKYYIK